MAAHSCFGNLGPPHRSRCSRSRASLPFLSCGAEGSRVVLLPGSPRFCRFLDSACIHRFHFYMYSSYHSFRNSKRTGRPASTDPPAAERLVPQGLLRAFKATSEMPEGPALPSRLPRTSRDPASGRSEADLTGSCRETCKLGPQCASQGLQCFAMLRQSPSAREATNLVPRLFARNGPMASWPATL